MIGVNATFDPVCCHWVYGFYFLFQATKELEKNNKERQQYSERIKGKYECVQDYGKAMILNGLVALLCLGLFIYEIVHAGTSCHGKIRAMKERL